jgi:hypothetical protein
MIAAPAVGVAAGAVAPMFIGAAGAGAGLCAAAPAMVIPPINTPHEPPQE